MLEKVEQYCSTLLKGISISKLPFHNIQHTESVISNVATICRSVSMSKDEMEPILLAAWFHDTGFIDSYKGHETRSCEIARNFLKKEGYKTQRLSIVISCIMATRLPQSPNNLEQGILCDADLFHLGCTDYFYWQTLLRKEWEVAMDKAFGDKEWYELNLEFLSSHKFQTPYGLNALNVIKRNNKKRLIHLIESSKTK
ncbi:HD domain-containing protein [Roseivirga pacifica]|uniref:HD domain-containing protein n=2 Tax=Roseivirga pacifica TaxID=1267423 RepID=A0A1I0Q0Y4_9BACT|nr:HD domain-containing protein [Roseivirga pacifica]RKQ43352.1 HD domain-containing protein [Roseivirga pacifica]SEW20526.1 HD domain-containing protein [Roseivirga pacifica]